MKIKKLVACINVLIFFGCATFSIKVCRDPRWGRCFESYSEDPKVVQVMTEIVPGLQGDFPPGSQKGVPYVAGK